MYKPSIYLDFSLKSGVKIPKDHLCHTCVARQHGVGGQGTEGGGGRLGTTTLFQTMDGHEDKMSSMSKKRIFKVF